MGSDNFTVGSAVPVGPIEGAAWSGERKRRGDERTAPPRAVIEETEAEESDREVEPSNGLDVLA